MFQSVLFGVKLKDTFCWSKPIFSPFEGEVVEVSDGLKERDPVHIVRDLFTVIKNGFLLKAETNSDLKHLLGNYIILKGEDAYSLIAHARCNSIIVSAGQNITEGQHLADVGHSGNSTMPHLHFQLMDRPQLMKAKGLPCCFKNLKVFNEGRWNEVTNFIPGRRVRINV